MTHWFEVDKAGLAKLVERRGKSFVVFELLQNAWDTDATRVDVTLRSVAGRSCAELIVEDDEPEGFKRLSDAWTLFAESEKKADVKKRGRFNLGEKLVLAACAEATITTTTGAVRFDDSGRHLLRVRRPHGSEFRGLVRMTRPELETVLVDVARCVPPTVCRTTLNGEPLAGRVAVAEFEATLPTEVADADGILRKAERRALVRVLEPTNGEAAVLYELGIPVVETGDRFHVSVEQKVPLTLDRQNVPPAFLRAVRVFVLNQTFGRLRAEDAASKWVREARGDDRVDPRAVTRTIALQFGERRAIADPSEPEATKLAVSRGYTVIPGGALSRQEWTQVKRAEAALPAGLVTPVPKPYGPGGKPLKLLDDDDWTSSMQSMARYARRLAHGLLGGRSIEVRLADERSWPFNATYGAGRLVLNARLLGLDWFLPERREEQTRLLLHEFAHEWESDHLSAAFHEAVARLGAKAVALALRDPDLWKSAGVCPDGQN